MLTSSWLVRVGALGLCAAPLLGAPASAQSYGRLSSPYSRPLPVAAPQPVPMATIDSRDSGYGYAVPAPAPAPSQAPAPVQTYRSAASAGFPNLFGGRTSSLPPDADPNYSSLENYDDEIDGRTTRKLVNDPTNGAAGDITIETRTRKLYYSQGDGKAWEYGIGVGKQGFSWKGTALVGRKAVWPGWTPPPEMIARRPELPVHMDGGMRNPLGARALYLFQNNKDTLFRIHGTNEPESIGHAVSSGCIRMLNADVLDLFQRVPVGTKVNVL